MTGVHRHTAGTLGGDSLHQLILVALLDVDKPDVPGALVLGLVPALVVLALVGVTLLGVDAAVLLDVLEGVVHQTSVTALQTELQEMLPTRDVAHVVPVAPAAVHQILLGEADQFTSGAVVHRLQGSGGGEGPAGPALTLVLHWSDRPLLSPVNVDWEVGGVSRHQILGSLGSPCTGVDLPVTVECGHKLVVEKVTKLIHTKVVRVDSLSSR